MRGPANSRVQQYPRLAPLLTGPRAWPVVCLLRCWEVHSLAGGCCHRRVWCCTCVCVCVWLQGRGRMLWADSLLGVQQPSGWCRLDTVLVLWSGSASCAVAAATCRAARTACGVHVHSSPGRMLSRGGQGGGSHGAQHHTSSGGRPLLGLWGCMPWLRAPCKPATHERNRWHSKTSDLLRRKQQSWLSLWPTAQGVRVLQRTAPAPPGGVLPGGAWFQLGGASPATRLLPPVLLHERSGCVCLRPIATCCDCGWGCGGLLLMSWQQRCGGVVC